MEWRRIETARGASIRVLSGGSGAPLVFLHGAAGLDEHDPLLARLAERYAVHAPELPGYGESQGEGLLEDMLDFTLHGWDVVTALGLERPHLVGHSMGGMLAAEMACVAPREVERLVLLAPLGLWLDDHPVPDMFTMLPFEFPQYMFHDPDKGAAAMTGGVDFTDMDALAAFFIGNSRRLGMAGKILFPIPNRRLSKRLYRLTAETLLVWGESDRMLPMPYAEHWQRSVPHAELVTIAEAGHALGVEQPDAVGGAVEKFLG